MITIKEARKNNLLDTFVLSTVPEKCRCGADNIFTESLTELQCSNPKCVYKISKRLFKMTQEIGLDNWDEASCTELCEKFNFTTPFQILLVKQLLDNSIDTGILDFGKKVKDIVDFRNTEIELWKIVKIANIRYASTVAEKIFGSYDNMQDAYNDIENGQVSHISDKLGIESNEASIMAIMVYNQIIEHKDELMFAETQLNVIKHKADPIRVAISGGVPGYLNRADLLTMLNNRYHEYASFVLDSAITDKTKVLIASYDRTSTKYRTAKRINEKYISQSIQNEEFDLDDIGKFNNTDSILAIGEKIAIVNIDELLVRLNRVFKCNK